MISTFLLALTLLAPTAAANESPHLRPIATSLQASSPGGGTTGPRARRAGNQRNRDQIQGVNPP